jgi:ribonuclease P protein component
VPTGKKCRTGRPIGTLILSSVPPIPPDPPHTPAREPKADAKPVRLRFGRGHRLTKAREFEAVHKARTRKTAGPLGVSAIPNGLAHSRLGLSIGRRVGPAVVRSRVKRLIREAFRLEQRSLPPGLDLVVSVRSAADAELAIYREALVDAALELQSEWERRRRRAARQSGETR